MGFQEPRIGLTTNNVRRRAMNKSSLFRFALPTCLFLVVGLEFVSADETTITQGNSRFVLTQSDPTSIPPGAFASTGEWFVDGRRILTYVSSPGNQIDLTHHHSDAHVRVNQLHAAGRLSTVFGLPDGILGGLVYTLNGAAVGSGNSHLTELLELTLDPNTTTSKTLNLVGFGFRPFHSFEIPDLTGLRVTGTTVVIVSQGSFTVPPFGSVTTRFRSFTGFNPFTTTITLNPGGTVRMITELNVSPAQ